MPTKFLDGQGNFSTPPTPPAGGQLLNVVFYTSNAGADTYIPKVGCTTAIIFALGGGGGGGGVTGATSNANAAAAGGSGGGWAWLITPVTQAHTYVVAIGAAGTAATAGNNAGGNGGDTTIETDGGAGLVRAKGGTGGAGMAQSTAAKINGGTVGTAGTTGGNLNMTGHAGDGSFCVATSVAKSGKGGDSPYGSGGRSLAAVAAGSVGGGKCSDRIWCGRRRCRFVQRRHEPCRWCRYSRPADYLGICGSI
jgi:hypothetical protein